MTATIIIREATVKGLVERKINDMYIEYLPRVDDVINVHSPACNDNDRICRLVVISVEHYLAQGSKSHDVVITTTPVVEGHLL